MDKVHFSQVVPFGPYLRLAFYRYFSRPLIIVLMAVCGLNLGYILYSWVREGGANLSMGPFGILLMLMVLLPLILYLNTRAAYDSSHLLQEEVSVQVSDEGVAIEGEGFSYATAWEHMYEVREFASWLVLYTSRFSAYYIYKPALPDPSDWEILRAIIRSKPDLNYKLKGE
ncbi:MAG: hypothetical protein D6722_12460 [Bacteroidetes bacterium]|nr:MAG: hypothetical protein D6722_12460 [Bacteroidota bacterium]